MRRSSKLSPKRFSISYFIMILLVYFDVLLKLGQDSKIEIKIAPCLKFPYVCKGSDSFSRDNTIGSYSDFYGTILFKEASCDRLSYRTYFRTQKNVILYHNHIFGNTTWYSRRNRDSKYKLFWFMIDLKRDIYRPIEIPKLDYVTSKNGSLLVKIKDKFYVLSKELHPKESLNDIASPIYVAVIDASSGEALFLEDRKHNLHLDLYYPIANKVVPVLQFNKKGLLVHLVDILDKKVNTISWNIDEIRQIIIDIINKDSEFKYVRKKILQDTFEHLHSAGVSQVNYTYDAVGERINNHVKSIIIYFEILIKGKRYEYRLKTCGIVIVFEQESIKCYLDLQHARFELNDEKMALYKQHYRETNILLQEIPTKSEVPEIFLPNVLYSNKCYDILYNTMDGVAITMKKRDIAWKRKSNSIYDDYRFTKSAVYRHKNYLFIIKFANDKDPSHLVVVDLRSDTLYSFISKGDFRILLDRDPEHRLDYISCYFKLNNKIIFLSRDLRHMFAIKLNELDKKLRTIKQNECKEEHYEYIEDFVEIFEFKQLLSNTILLTHKVQIEDGKIEVLGYRIDRDWGKLYIAAVYDIDNIRYAGLFEFKSSLESTSLKLINYYPYEHVLYHKNKPIANLSSTVLHRKNKNEIPANLPSLIINMLRDTKVFNNDLEVVCNLKPMIVDVKNNRISTRIIPESFYVTKVQCENLGDLLVVELTSSSLKPIYITESGREFFVLSRLNLVSKMLILSL